MHIEGYPPPYDPRIEVIKVTPDPGVIEVNIHPGAKLARGGGDHQRPLRRGARAARRRQIHDRWPPYRHRRRQPYRGRRQHAADSPFLRRPDLLKSLVLYWQRHPSLSYLFSGLFIGPTSQAPRIDEARHDGLYELEIAFDDVPPPGAESAALAGRPPVPQSAGRCHRQHPSHRNLHRQALFAGRADRPARPGRVSRASRCRPIRGCAWRSNCCCAR